MLNSFPDFESPPLKPVRVIAVGSPYGDDRVGWAVAELLRTVPEYRRFLLGNISIIECDRPGPALLEYLQGDGYVLIVDAVVNGSQAGQLVRVDTVDDLDGFDHYSSHGLGLAETLRMADVLGTINVPWVVLGVTIEPPGESVPQDGPLSQAVLEAAHKLARVVAMEACAELPRMQACAG